MKKLLAILLLIATPVMAAEDMPEYMKDGVITVTLKDGNVYTFSTNEYKVVRRGSKAAPKVAEEAPSPAKEAPRNYGYSAILHAGVGAEGLQVGHNGSQFVIREDEKPVLGLTLCKNDTMRNGPIRGGLCGTALTNKTFLMGIKLDFE